MNWEKTLKLRTLVWTYTLLLSNIRNGASEGIHAVILVLCEEFLLSVLVHMKIYYSSNLLYNYDQILQAIARPLFQADLLQVY